MTQTKTAFSILLLADGAAKEVSPAGRYWTLEEMQQLVGGLIEIVPLADGRILVINEEGKLHDLPVNVAATNHFLVQRAAFSTIVGDALLCERGEIE